MKFIRNILAVIGAVAIAAAIWIGPQMLKFKDVLGDMDMASAGTYVEKFKKYKAAFKDFDPKALATYEKMMDQLVETGNSAAATVWKAKVAEGLTYDDVNESIKNIANERNIRAVGELPLGDQVGAMQGKPWRKLNIYLFCNPLTAAKMVEYDPAYAAYLPCRISLVEDAKKQLWIYTLDMDMMIYGGKTLPPALLKEALEVKDIMQDILKRAAEGDF